MIQNTEIGGQSRLAVVMPEIYQNQGDVDAFGNSLFDTLLTISSYTETKNAILCETFNDLLELAMIFKNLK